MKILVPLDGSPDSELAVPCAIALARRLQGTIVFLRSSKLLREKGLRSEDRRLVHQAVEAYLGEQAAKAEGLETEIRVDESGHAADAILEASEEADLVVLAHYGSEGVRQKLFGSVTDKVVRHTHCPVLVVHSQGNPGAPQRVVVPLDTSPLAEKALETAQKLLAPGGTLTLAHVVHPLEEQYLPVAINTAPLEEVQESRAKEYMARLCERLETPCRTVIMCARPADGILKIAEEAEADLIVLSAHSRGRLGRLMFGSVAEKVLKNSDRSVLVVKPR